jgi:NAD(P)-dependent dehydrogenase (short-subunit alcohol dehydrogenase family)
MRLQDKVAIVTGGAHGMGEAEARLFAKEGAKVVVADILASEAEAVAANICKTGGEAIAFGIDVTSEAEWTALIERAVASWGRLDILVNNAGISGSSVGDPDGLAGWDRIIAVNQTSVFLGTKLAAPQMAKTGGGSIVNISSIMGFVGGSSGHPAYCASKGAVRIYSKAAALGPAGGAGQHRASRLHAADAERDQRRRARRQDRADAIAPARRADRGCLGRPLPRLRRGLVRDRHRTRHRRRFHRPVGPAGRNPADLTAANAASGPRSTPNLRRA